jgi:uncharacterized membrane protein YqjE
MPTNQTFNLIQVTKIQLAFAQYRYIATVLITAVFKLIMPIAEIWNTVNFKHQPSPSIRTKSLR